MAAEWKLPTAEELADPEKMVMRPRLNQLQAMRRRLLDYIRFCRDGAREANDAALRTESPAVRLACSQIATRLREEAETLEREVLAPRGE